MIQLLIISSLTIGLIGLLRFRSLIVRFILFAYWYPLVPMVLFIFNYPVGRVLDVVGRPLYYSYALEAFCFAIVGYAVVVIVIWRFRNECVRLPRFRIGESFRILIVLLLYVLAFIAYPKAFGISASRWNLLPGQWSVVYLAVNVFILLSFRSAKTLSTILHIAILLFVIKGGERVDSIVVLIWYVFFEVKTTEVGYLVERKLSFRLVFILLGIFVIGVGAGLWRGGSTLDFLVLIYSVLAQHTVVDVVHVYFSSFHYVENIGLNHYPLFNEFFGLIPTHPLGGTHSIFNFTNILKSHIPNPGGGLFYSEGVLIFGKIGVVIYSLLYGLLIRFFLTHIRLLSFLFVVFFILQLRIQWYGFLYIYSTVLIVLSLLFFYKGLKLSYNSLN